MKERPISVILIIVSTLALVAVLYASTMAVCAMRQIPIPPEVGGAFKDFALVALGAIGGLLTSMSTSSGPVPTTVTNTPANPVETHES